MRKPHPEKVALINLVKTWRKRVGLPVRDLVSQMNRHLNQQGFTQEILTEHSFRILFTDHPERNPRVSPERAIALLTVIRKYRTDIPGCTAEEALQLAELVKLPVIRADTGDNSGWTTGGAIRRIPRQQRPSIAILTGDTSPTSLHSPFGL